MKPRSRTITLLLLPALFLRCELTLAQPDIFSGLPYDTADIHATIERHTTRIEAEAGAPEIPGSVSYRIFVQELLEDPRFDAPASDMRILGALVRSATEELAGTHRQKLNELCTQIEADDVATGAAVQLATRFDASRLESERDLNLWFSDAVARMTPETAQALDTRWREFSSTRTVVYTNFDMSGFARAMPDAALRMMREGCTRFRDVTTTP